MSVSIEHIWDQYRSKLQAFVHSRVANEADAQDLLQDILLRSYNNLASLRDETSVKAWLFQIAHNAIVDHYRASGRRPLDTDVEDLWYSQEALSASAELARCVEPFIDALPDETAHLMREVELGGMSQKDYAEAHGIAYSTLKSRVQKGRRELRGLFDRCCDFDLDSRGNLAEFSSKPGSCKNC